MLLVTLASSDASAGSLRCFLVDLAVMIPRTARETFSPALGFEVRPLLDQPCFGRVIFKWALAQGAFDFQRLDLADRECRAPTSPRLFGTKLQLRKSAKGLVPMPHVRFMFGSL